MPSRFLSALLVLLATGVRAGAVGPAFAGDQDRWVGAEILLRDPNVLKDLGLNDQQAFKLSPVLIAVAGKLNDELQHIQGLTGEGWKAKHREIVATYPDVELDALARHLTARQIKRLREITYQTAGVDAFAHAGVLKQLAPTTEQKDKLKTIAADLENKLKEVQQLYNAGKVDAAAKKESALRADALKRVVETLTDNQRKTWHELIGKPIQLEINK